MTLTIPRDLVLEMYLGRWIDVTALAIKRGLRQSDPVSVSWGSAAEQGKVPPSTAEGVLNNEGGHWTPGNPMSDYHDYLQGRNAPTRLGLRVSRDTFADRTSAFSWLTSDTGDGWNDASSGSGVVAVGSGVGTHTQPNANAYVITFLGDSYPDCQVAITGSWNLNVAGGAIEPLNLVLRYQPTGTHAGEHYLLRASVSAAEELSLSIHHSTLGAISPTVVVATLTPGVNSLRGKFQMEGQTLRGKIYAAGPSDDPDQVEPVGWLVSAHHNRLTGGFPGVRTGVAAGNTNVPVTVTYDDWDLRLLEHTGELTELRPSWDKGHKVKKAAFKTADITQRLGRPQRPALSSAPRRYLAEGKNAEFTPSDFWPLDELPTALVAGLNAVPGGVPAQFIRPAGIGGIQWGATDANFASAPAFPVLTRNGTLYFNTQSAQLSSSMSTMWAMRVSPDDQINVRFDVNFSGGIAEYGLDFYTDGTFELQKRLAPVAVTTGTFKPTISAARWMTFGLTLFNNGGTSVGYHFNIDGVTLGVGTWDEGRAYTAPVRIRLNMGTGAFISQEGSALSSMVVTPQRFDSIVPGTATSYGAKLASALRGWPGETAGLRAFRLAAEEGVPFDYYGDLEQTRVMGPQRPAPLLDQLQECADLDGALLFAPRYALGVAFRPRRTMGARDPDSTLSYSAGHVSELTMAADDRPTANFVRAEKIGGGFLVVEQASGPMNTKDPDALPHDPEAVGKTPAKAVVNVESEAQLGDVGGWVRALGTDPEVRFRGIAVDLANRDLTTGADPTKPARELVALRPGDRMLVQGTAAADVYRDLDQLIRGGKTTFRDRYRHAVTFNTAPYEKYRVGVFGDAGSRFASGGVTTIDDELGAGVIGARDVNVVSGSRWTLAAGAFPMDVLIGGERVTLSGITGAGAAQVMTISARAVNGAARTHAAGTPVTLHQPVYFG